MAITGVEVFYGDYQFKPAPLMSISREQYKANDGTVFGGGYRVSLNGSLLPGTVRGTGLTTAEAANVGTLPSVSGHSFDGTANAMSSFRAKDDLLHALNQDGQLFKVRFMGSSSDALCDGYVIYTSGTRINEVQFDSDDQWVKRVNYTIDLFSRSHLSTGTGLGDVGSYKQWSGAYDFIAADTGVFGTGFEFAELQSYERDYSVEVLARPQQFGTGCTPLWLQVGVSTSAQSIEGSETKPYFYPPTPADFDDIASGFLKQEAAFTGTASGFIDPVLTQRNHGINILGGSFNWSDTYVMKPTSGTYVGAGVPTGNVIDTFSVDVESSLEDAIVKVSLQGELKGLESFAGTSTADGSGQMGPLGAGTDANNKMSTAIARAQMYLDEAMYSVTGVGRNQAVTAGTTSNYAFKESGTPLFFNRAATAYSGLGSPSTIILNLLPEPMSKSLAYNTNEGTISYNLAYNNRPDNCYSGALSETISISRGLATDVHASLTILGRANGPILQDIGTKTASTTECSIEAIVVPDNGGFCTGNLWVGAPTGFYSELIDSVEAGIGDNYETYFKTADNVNWDPKTGRLGRTAAWIHTDC